MLKLKIITTGKDLALLSDSWQQLHHQTASGIFQSWEFVDAWRKTLGVDYQPLILTVYENTDLKGIAPLKLGAGRKKNISFLTAPEGEHQDFILDRLQTEPVLQLIVKELINFRRAGFKVSLEDIAQDSKLLEFYPRVFDQHASWLTGLKSPYIDKSLLKPGKFSKLDTSQRMKKLMRLGNVRVQSATSPEQAKSLVQTLITWHQARFSDSQDVYRLRQGNYEPFLNQLVDNLFAPGKIIISYLALDNKPLAVEILLRNKHSLCSYMQNFDPNMKQYSPGSLLTQDILNYWKNTENLQEFDFLRGQYQFKNRYATSIRKNFNLSMPLNPWQRQFIESAAWLRSKAKQISWLKQFYRKFKKI
jgi:CelD/BcsL family acetyltransferase involved in cellulose biosynthesis